MRNLKIRVSNEAESREAQDLFFKLGYRWIDIGAVYYKISPTFNYITAYCNGKTLAQGHGLDTKREITTPELRDMVVLKRNDVNDATHENSIYKYFKACDGWYYFDLGCTDKWQKSAGAKPEYYEKLKPIEKNMKEYLEPLRYGGYKYHKDPDAYLSTWLEIHKDAEFAVLNGNDDVDFYTGSALEKSHFIPESIIWQREQDEPFLTPECTLNDQYAEIEQVRQVKIHGTVKAKPDFNFGAAQSTKDNVNHPSHYADSAIECIDAMEAMMTPEQFIGYLRGNLFKYQWRYEKKNGIEDLKKAQWYLEKLTAKVAEKNAPF